MHGDGGPPILVIKKQMALDEGAPDYSGPGYTEARRTMLSSDGGRSDRVVKLDEIASQLEEASRKHAAQAARIRDLADEICRDAK